MLRDQLRDSAIEAAKAYSHPSVERRHVLYAIARRLRDTPGFALIFVRARHDLEPRGNWDKLPVVSNDAEALLATISSPEDGSAALKAAFAEGGPPTAPPDAAIAITDPAHPVQTAAPVAVPRESTADVLRDLDGLIGLASVKTQVKRVIAVVQANAERVRAGLIPVNPGLHLVFTGPPGTGKTTVARLVARLYASTGALPGAKFTEASRADLVAGYVGQTALKTAELIERARPGVLLIDEAYSLTPTHSSDFGAEAIATLVKAMEDHRHDFAVIAAGYGDEMADFIESNPGLRSRFKTYIHFPDYTPSELTAIFASFAEASGIALDDGVLPKAEAIFRQTQGATHLGNARFARSLFEDAYARMSIRAAADGTMELTELSAIAPEDIEWIGGGIERERRRVGFGRKADPGTEPN
jgi:Holliday junction resolvasome RuvABC ATP-dependent DNA helicase subunit